MLVHCSYNYLVRNYANPDLERPLYWCEFVHVLSCMQPIDLTSMAFILRSLKACTHALY